MHRHRDLVLLMALAAGTPALGQNTGPAFHPTIGATQSTTAVPDFSGTWVYPFCCGFAPPPSGPGPVLNLSRLPPGALPGVSAPVGSLWQFVGDYTNPILKPVASEAVKKHGQIEASGVVYPTPRNQCWPEGVPFVFGNMGMQLLQQSDNVTILYEHDHQVRRIRMNTAHPAQLVPSWYGDSVGRYEGDTLVIDTVGVKSGPFAMIDWYGTPYTNALHVVERYRLVDDETAKEAEERAAKEIAHNPFRFSGATGLAADPEYRGKALLLQFTVQDENVFTMPWSATIIYRRSFAEWPEFACAENLRGIYAEKDSDVPRAETPDF